MKITIIGNAAGGKTTLAKKISRKLDIPHVQLDRFWFKGGGFDLKEKGDEESRQKVQDYIKDETLKFIVKDNWVSDGFYSKVQPLIYEQANQLIFLDIPMYKRLANHIKRVFCDERHPELSKWDEFKFIFDIIRRTILKGPKMEKFAEEHSEKLTHLRSYKEVEKYLEKFTVDSKL